MAPPATTDGLGRWYAGWFWVSLLQTFRLHFYKLTHEKNPLTLHTIYVCVCVYICIYTHTHTVDLILSVFVCRYFLVDADGNILSNQEGTFRSNCMDCLDRTNVIQSLLARRSLQSQLQVTASGPAMSEPERKDGGRTYHTYIGSSSLIWRLELSMAAEDGCPAHGSANRGAVGLWEDVQKRWVFISPVVAVFYNTQPVDFLKILNISLPFCSNTAWADNADACAKQYAGTGALKTDFTRWVFTLPTSRFELSYWNRDNALRSNLTVIKTYLS